MKKIILILTGLIIFMCSRAQQYDTLKYITRDGVYVNKNDSVYLNKTCVTMTNGKIMFLKNGSMVPLDQAMVMQNGTIIMTNGMIKTKEGVVSQMNEGECLDMFGEMIPVDHTKMQNDGPPPR